MDEKEQGCGQSRSRDLKGRALDASIAPGTWPYPAHAEHQQDMGPLQMLWGFLRRQNIFLAD